MSKYQNKQSKHTKNKFVFRLLFLIFFSSQLHISAQNTEIDGLYKLLKTTKIDTEYVYNSIRLANHLTNDGYHDSAIAIVNKTIYQAQDLNFIKGLAEAYCQLGIIYFNKSLFSNAIKSYSLSVKYYNQIGDIEMSASMLKNIGLVYRKQGKFSEALKLQFLALKMYEKIAHKAGIAQVSKSIGIIYFNLNNYKLALNYFTHSLKINLELNNEKQIAQDYLNIANVLAEQNKTNESLNLYNKSLLIKQKLNDKKGVALVLENIALTYHEQKNYAKSLQLYFDALKIYEELNDELLQAILLTRIGDVYTDLNKIKLAKQFIEKGIIKLKKIGSLNEIKEAYEMLVRVDSANGDFKQAYLNFKIFNSYKDSVFNDELAYETSEHQTKYETNKKEQQIAELKKKEEINSLKLTQRNYAITSLLLIVLLISISIVFFIKQQKQKRLLAIQQTEENERRRMAKDIHDDLGSGLSKIKIISETITNKAQNNPEILIGVKSISNTTIGLVENMRDLIWALNTENTTISSLVAQIREYSSEYIDGTDKKIIYNIPKNIPDKKIETQVYRNIYFIVKESLQNIVKHSQATQITLTVSLNNTHLNIQINDNGIGINSNSKNGNGLNNMKNRALIALSEFTIDSSKSGTTINLKTKI